MEIHTNRKILKIGVVIISIFLMTIIIFANLIKLEKPVFLKNYIERQGYSNDGSFHDEFIIKYITNVNDPRSPVDIKLSGENGENVDFDIDNKDESYLRFFTDPNMDETYGRYIIKSIFVNLSLDIKEDKFEELEFNKANIIFDNGEALNVDLGKIVYYERQEDSDNKYIDYLGSSSSSDGTGNSNFNIKNDIIAKKIDSRLLEDIREDIEITLMDKDYLSIKNTKLKANNIYSIKYEESFVDDPIKKYNSYNTSLYLYFEDENGELHKEVTGVIFYQPFDFKFIDILKYLRARGEI